MKQTTPNYTWKAIGLGAIAGIRSLSAPALLSNELQDAPPALLQNSPFRYLQSGAVATSLKLLAASELVGDKIPDVPNRTTLPALAMRAASGAVVGAAVFTANHDSAMKGALLGGISAVAATYGSFFLRKALRRYSHLPNAVCGAIEDSLMLRGGLAVAKM